jgi:hypothetical protein
VSLLHIIFLAAFIGGLVLAVFAMLHGVEYMRRNRSHAPSPFFNLPAIAAFSVLFGAVGYPLASHSDMPAWGIILIAIAGGTIAMAALIVLLARWALRGGRHVSDDLEGIQGQLAVVSKEITLAGTGEISYSASGVHQQIPARALGERSLPVGSEVVIDRIENAVAFVEEWAVVEQRL